MDEGDRKLFEEGLRRATERHTGAALDTALEELGWFDALDDDFAFAVSAFFELQGSANVTSSALDDVLAARLGFDPAAAAVVLPQLGSWQPPATVEHDELLVRGVATMAGVTRSQALVATQSGGFVVSSADLAGQQAQGMDPALELREIAVSIPLAAARPLDGADWPAALASGQVAAAHELVGCSLAMLRLAREHALDRVQFDRPISGFQAVRHRLAESLVAIEGAQASLAAAQDDYSPPAAALAKSIAGSAARTVARHAQQVLGGIGFTTDHAHHRYFKRVMVLDQLLGSQQALTRQIGEQLLRERRLPPMLPL